MEPLNLAEMVSESHRLEKLGLFSAALEGYKNALETAPGHPIAAIRYYRLRRDLRPDIPRHLKILWQIDPRGDYWETDWVRYLLSGLNCTEIIDGGYTLFHDGCIVIDNKIGPEKGRYYFEFLKRGYRFGLFHLSDEQFYDDCGAYHFANCVLRNYWSRGFSGDQKVLAVPLGTMNGFHADSEKTARERRNVWAFAGNASKSTRGHMFAAMSTIEGGFFHGTYGTVPHPAAPELKAPLTIAHYARVMSDTIFAPCPAGWENLDSFRVCEAFEAGCIPIVEKRPAYDYFQHLMIGNPALVIQDWNEAPQLLRALAANAESLEEKRLSCVNWWRTYKAAIIGNVRAHVLGSFTPAGV